MRAATITLGGSRYPIERLPIRKAQAWRARAEGLLAGLPELRRLYASEADDAADLVEASLRLYAAAGSVVEELIEVVLTGSPVLEAARDWILDQAYEEEFLEGLQTLLLLNAPLAGLALGTAQLAPARNGDATPTTA
jgi:hypothetical protein